MAGGCPRAVGSDLGRPLAKLRGGKPGPSGRALSGDFTLAGIIRTKVVPESVIYTDSFRSYDGLLLDGFKHYRINHHQCFATGRRQHINGIQNFLGHAETKLKSYYNASCGLSICT